ncbi:hypothetical protein Tco_1365967 [Tanacetum coccineum]
MSCLLHPRSPTHPSTLILSQGESSGELSDGGPDHPPSPDYVLGLEHLPSPVEVPYILEPEYPEYLVPSDIEAPLEDQPLPADASPTALSPGYIADSDPDEDPEEDPEEDHADYPVDGGDDDDDPSDDDDDTNEEDEEPFKDEDDDKEEEHLAPADSSTIPVVNLVPSVWDTEVFETDESVPAPRSPQIRIPFAQTCLYRTQKTFKLEPPMSPSIEACIAEYAAAPAPSSPPPSPLSPWSSPLPYIPSPPLLTSTIITTFTTTFDHREDILEAELPPHKRLCLIALTSRAEEVGYSIRDDPTEAVEEVAPTTLEGVNARVTELAAVQEQDTQDIYAMIEDTQDRQTQLFQRVDGLVEDRQFHYETTTLVLHVSILFHSCFVLSTQNIIPNNYELQAYRTHTQMQDYRIASHESLITTLIAHVSSLQGQLSAALGHIQALQARDQTHVDDPEGAGSSA